MISNESVAHSLARLNQAQWVFGGATGTSGAGLAGMSATKIDKSRAGPYDQVCAPGPRARMRVFEPLEIIDAFSRYYIVT